MMDRDRLLNDLLPHRMQAVATLNLVLKLYATYDASPMTLYAGDKLVIEGNLLAFINPAIEAGMMHCRALLEFLGLCNDNGRLSNISRPRRSTDVGIEHFSTSEGPLEKVTPSKVLRLYPGPSDEAENALLAVFHVTNKGLAHVTKDLSENPGYGALIEIASRGIPSLVVSYLYTPLGLPAPDYKLTHRPRDR
jgi:hypothetical protein